MIEWQILGLPSIIWLLNNRKNIKGHSSLVWYSIDREDQSNESIFCTKDESLDWTEITKNGTRQNG